MTAPNYALYTSHARPTLRTLPSGEDEWAVDWYNGRGVWASTALGLTREQAIDHARRDRRRWRRLAEVQAAAPPRDGEGTVACPACGGAGETP